MGGRESRGGPGSDRAAAGVVGSDVTTLEESCTRSKRESHRVREGRRRGRSPAVYSRHSVQWIGPGGADPAEGEQVGNRDRSGAHRRPRRRRGGTGLVHRSGRPVATDLEEPSAGSVGSVGARDQRIRVPSVAEEAEGRGGRCS